MLCGRRLRANGGASWLHRSTGTTAISSARAAESKDVRDTCLPFATGKLYGGKASTFYATAALRKILAYFNLGSNLTDWRNWLANNGPIMARLDVDSTWDDASFTGGNLDPYNPNSTRGGHAVALVGYTASRFIVRNSWGTGWSDKGFAYASLAYAQEAFTEVYGVEV